MQKKKQLFICLCDLLTQIISLYTSYKLVFLFSISLLRTLLTLVLTRPSDITFSKYGVNKCEDFGR